MHLPQIIALGFFVVVAGGLAIALCISRAPMTDDERWRRKKAIRIHADAPPEQLAKIVRWKLADPRFTGTEELSSGREFRTRFRYDQQTLSVKLHIRITPESDGTALLLRCFPEWFTNTKAIGLYHVELQSFASSVCSTKILTAS